MKLSIVILCWNDRRVIADCLRSIFANTHSIQFEVIVCDNGSTDGSAAFIRSNYPSVQVIENGKNLRFAKANNVGIRASRGEYILILNPDTLIHDDALDRMIQLADQYPNAGAFGCRVLNANGSYQVSARPFASLKGEWISALYLRSLGNLSNWFTSDSYAPWNGTTQRPVDWISGCSMLIRSSILKALGGFDEQFFYYYEDMDLCRRIWQAGYQILFFPNVSITHLGGQSTKRKFPALAFVLDGQVTRYLYYYKYYGRHAVQHARRIALVSAGIRFLFYAARQFFHSDEVGRNRLALLRGLFEWNYRVAPIQLVENGEEPRLKIPTPGRVCER